MTYAIVDWVISAVAFGPFIIGVPLLVLWWALDEYLFGPRLRWR